MSIRCSICDTLLFGPEAQTQTANDDSEATLPVCRKCLSRAGSAREVLSVDEADRTHNDPGDPNHLLPGDFVGRFRLVKKVGEGGFGTVFRAHDPVLQREVALKIPRFDRLSPELAADYLQEARATAQIRCPHIVQVHEVGGGTPTTPPYIVTDYIEGPTLRQWLFNRKPTLKEALTICSQLARGLHAAHRAGIVHRDFKPGNVLIDRGSTPMILDFGLARWQQQTGRDPISGDRSQRENDGDGVLGTPAYMSPEQASGKSATAGPASDIFSLGVVLYEMLQGVRPFQGRDLRELLQRIQRAEVRFPTSRKNRMPAEIAAICSKALAQNPEDRFPTALELAEDLERYLNGQPTRTKPPPVWVVWGRRAKRNGWAVASGTLLMGLGVAGWFGWQSFEESRRNLARIEIVAEPPEAILNFVPVDPEDGQAHVEKAVSPPPGSPCRLTLQQGHYLVEAVWPDGSSLQTFRLVSRDSSQYQLVEHGAVTASNTLRAISAEKFHADGRVQLPGLKKPGSPDNRFTFIRGGPFTTGSSVLSQFPFEDVTLAPFLIEREEVTFQQFLDVMGTLPAVYSVAPLKWPEPENRARPVVGVSWHEAAEYAERTGARLPTLDEYLFVATNGGTTEFPWSDDPEPARNWDVTAASVPPHDRTRHSPPVLGLYSRVAEWTQTSPGKPLAQTAFFHKSPKSQALGGPESGLPKLPPPDQIRILCGGGASVKNGTPFELEILQGPRMFNQEQVSAPGFPGLGFRTVRDTQPRFPRTKSP